MKNYDYWIIRFTRIWKQTFFRLFFVCTETKIYMIYLLPTPLLLVHYLFVHIRGKYCILACSVVLRIYVPPLSYFACTVVRAWGGRLFFVCAETKIYIISLLPTPLLFVHSLFVHIRGKYCRWNVRRKLRWNLCHNLSK